MFYRGGVITPPFPYSGGKRKVLDNIKEFFPKEYDRYFEPFLGGGAVLLDIQPNRAIVSDINIDVVNTFREIRNNPEQLIDILNSFENSQEEYYRLRQMDRQENWNSIPDIFKAARFIYLSKLGYGCHARYNQKGENNQPYSNLSDRACFNEKSINQTSRYLKNSDVSIVQSSYDLVFNLMESKDFVYLDPPYYGVTHDYPGRKWTDDDFIMLKEKCDTLSEKGIKWVLSNSNDPFILNLFQNYDIHTFDITDTLSYPKGNKSMRGEVVIRNFIE